ncbi:MAG: hypothetical protein COX77_02560 [Candidatus Komeilibacteria bacterium CG_4_10_14_0_2_um_filter_37_10]|uniref:FAD-binding FR-type domain-containing protein n=1 Tax=Candidatus Komeilibacteria bacterium CG_4_10_14_0_2_um_filter_37_10 TaxID=1974470 RepID=A0A2M7VEX8_9BACT|nr:MAG: hypothetical protein COX77_02560 [Candidatus Komeilibacteria bacterium CG_4_10_14_0_2_um_filter_37_10]
MRYQKKMFSIIWLLNLFFIVLLWWNNNSDLLNQGLASNLLVWARLTGLLAVFFVLTQLLQIGRIKWLEPYFGHDRLARQHHYFGVLSFVMITLHFIFLLISYGQLSHLGWWQQIMDFVNNWEELSGAIVSWLLFLLTIIISISIVYFRWRYESWYYLHLLTYLAIILAFGHQLEWGGDLRQGVMVIYWWALYIFVGLNYLYYRFVLIVINYYCHQFRITKVVAENHNVYSIYLSGKQLVNFKYSGGQFVIARFLAAKFWQQAHPFSISQEPGTDNLRLTIKASGDFSKQIKNLPVGTPVLIDGAHGTFVPQQKKKQYLMIAGGIGITPIRAMLPEIINNGGEIILFYTNKKEEDLIFGEELKQIERGGHLHCFYHFTQEEGSLSQPRLDFVTIRKEVFDWAEREIYLCGPKPMIISLLAQFKEVGVPRSHIHYELFSW